MLRYVRDTADGTTQIYSTPSVSFRRGARFALRPRINLPLRAAAINIKKKAKKGGKEETSTGRKCLSPKLQFKRADTAGLLSPILLYRERNANAAPGTATRM